MVELRKRKAPADTAPPPVKKANSVKSFTSNKKGDSSTNGSVATSDKVAAGDTITIDGFGGEIEVRTFRSNLFCPLVKPDLQGELREQGDYSTPQIRFVTQFLV